MKTVKEWFDTLPEPISKWAIDNVSIQRENDRLSDKYGSLAEALVEAFTWSKSPQGYDFWNNILEYPIIDES